MTMQKLLPLGDMPFLARRVKATHTDRLFLILQCAYRLRLFILPIA